MTIWFISRHPGAIDWVRAQKLPIDHFVEHLSPQAVQPGDVVLGTLPVHLAAEITQRGARFFYLTMDVPAGWRGRELTRQELEQLTPTFREARVTLAPPIDIQAVITDNHPPGS